MSVDELQALDKSRIQDCAYTLQMSISNESEDSKKSKYCNVYISQYGYVSVQYERKKSPVFYSTIELAVQSVCRLDTITSLSIVNNSRLKQRCIATNEVTNEVRNSDSVMRSSDSVAKSKAMSSDSVVTNVAKSKAMSSDSEGVSRLSSVAKSKAMSSDSEGVSRLSSVAKSKAMSSDSEGVSRLSSVAKSKAMSSVSVSVVDISTLKSPIVQLTLHRVTVLDIDDILSRLSTVRVLDLSHLRCTVSAVTISSMNLQILSLTAVKIEGILDLASTLESLSIVDCILSSECRTELQSLYGALDPEYINSTPQEYTLDLQYCTLLTSLYIDLQDTNSRVVNLEYCTALKSVHLVGVYIIDLNWLYSLSDIEELYIESADAVVDSTLLRHLGSRGVRCTVQSRDIPDVEELEQYCNAYYEDGVLYIQPNDDVVEE